MLLIETFPRLAYDKFSLPMSGKCQRRYSALYARHMCMSHHWNYKMVRRLISMGNVCKLSNQLSSLQTPKSEPVRADPYNITFEQAVTGDTQTIDECSCCGAMILYLETSIRELVCSSMQAAYSQIFQEDVTIAATTNGHFGKHFIATYSSSYGREIK